MFKGTGYRLDVSNEPASALDNFGIAQPAGDYSDQYWSMEKTIAGVAARGTRAISATGPEAPGPPFVTSARPR